MHIYGTQANQNPNKHKRHETKQSKTKQGKQMYTDVKTRLNRG